MRRNYGERTGPWDIESLETFFAETKLPEGPIKLNKHTTINDPAKFVDVSLSRIKSKHRLKVYQSYYFGLIELKNYLKTLNA